MFNLLDPFRFNTGSSDPVLVASSYGNGAPSTITVDLPAGYTPVLNDLMVIYMTPASTAGDTSDSQLLPGWFRSSAAVSLFNFFHKRVTGDESWPVTIHQGGGPAPDDWAWVFRIYRNVGVFKRVTGTGGSGTTFTAPAVSPSWGISYNTLCSVVFMETTTHASLRTISTPGYAADVVNAQITNGPLLAVMDRTGGAAAISTETPATSTATATVSGFPYTSYMTAASPNKPTIVGQTQADNIASSTSIAQTLPAGIAADDYIFLYLMPASGGPTYTPPAGFTLLSSNAAGVPIAYKKATGSEGGTTVTWGLSAARVCGAAATVVRGLSTATAPAISSNSTSLTAVTTAFSWTDTAWSFVLYNWAYIGGTMPTGMAYPTGTDQAHGQHIRAGTAECWIVPLIEVGQKYAPGNWAPTGQSGGTASTRMVYQPGASV